jgi:hypothetical protein
MSSACDGLAGMMLKPQPGQQDMASGWWVVAVVAVVVVLVLVLVLAV